MKDIIIFGAGGFAREVLWTIEDINQEKNEWNILGFIDEKNDKETLNGYPVFSPSFVEHYSKGEIYVVNGVGSCSLKKKFVEQLKHLNCRYPNLIHPSAIVGRRVKFDGEGIIIQAGAILTTDIIVKSHVTINIDVTVGHDSILHEFATIAPGVHLSGYVTIGRGTDVGTGAVVIQGLKVGDECIIGANAAVIRDIPDCSVAVGVPAKVIKTIEKKGI